MSIVQSDTPRTDAESFTNHQATSLRIPENLRQQWKEKGVYAK